jgi:hypothetical protein
LGCGGSTSFWKDRWVRSAPLCDTFLRLFNISLQPELVIKDIGEWVNDRWIWNLKWRRKFFIWEEALYLEFVEVIALVSITKEVDSWSFKLGDQFSVTSIYIYKSNFSLLHLLGTIAKVWNSWVSSKVIVFSWQALLGRLPTRENLVRRGVVLEGPIAGCVLCGEGRETEDHLFASCPTTWEVWAKVDRWFGMTSVVSSTISSLFQYFFPIFRNRKHALKGVILIWHAVIWVLWRTRNERIFRGIVVGPAEIFDRIQVVSWKWLLAKKASSPCLFYEWCVESFDCIVR